MKCRAVELKRGDKLANPKTGDHVSTVIDTDLGMFQIGSRDCPEEERVIITVELKNGKQITRNVGLNYTFEVIDN